MVFFFTLSLIFSGAPFVQQFWGVFGRNTGFLTYFCLITIFLALIIFENLSFFKKIYLTLVFTSLPVTIYCLVQYANLDPINWSAKHVFATFGNTNFLSAFLGMGATAVFSQIFKDKPDLISCSWGMPEIYVGSNGLCKLSTPVWNAEKKSLSYKASAPRLAPDGKTVNTGFYYATISSADALALWGLKKPEEAASAESTASQRKAPKVSVQRYKGLGEMNSEELWETTMDPNRRILKQVAIEDAQDADMVFDMLMGTDVPARKSFIQSHAKEATLDI